MIGGWEDFQNYAAAITGSAGSLYGMFFNNAPPPDLSTLTLTGETTKISVTLPGFVQSENCSRRLEVERVKLEGKSGTIKLVKGFTDATLRFTLALPTDDMPDTWSDIVSAMGAMAAGDFYGAGEKLFGPGQPEPTTALQKLWAIYKLFVTFQKAAAEPLVEVWQITQEVAAANDVRRVLFVGIDNVRTSRSDLVTVDLEFEEYEPAVVLYETGQAQPPAEPPIPEPDTANPLE